MVDKNAYVRVTPSSNVFDNGDRSPEELQLFSDMDAAAPPPEPLAASEVPSWVTRAASPVVVSDHEVFPAPDLLSAHGAATVVLFVLGRTSCYCGTLTAHQHDVEAAMRRARMAQAAGSGGGLLLPMGMQTCPMAPLTSCWAARRMKRDQTSRTPRTAAPARHLCSASESAAGRCPSASTCRAHSLVLDGSRA